MIATDLIGAIIETDEGFRGIVRVVHVDKDGCLQLYVQRDDGHLRPVDALEDGARIVDGASEADLVSGDVAAKLITASTLTREHIDVVRRAEALSSSEISIAEVDLADEDRSTTAMAKVVAAYNRIAGGGGK